MSVSGFLSVFASNQDKHRHKPQPDQTEGNVAVKSHTLQSNLNRVKSAINFEIYQLYLT